jgi:hypothetical protein
MAVLELYSHCKALSTYWSPENAVLQRKAQGMADLSEVVSVCNCVCISACGFVICNGSLAVKRHTITKCQ